MGCSRKSRLLVFHSEGNILFNSGLMSLLSFLDEEGFAIDYFCPFFQVPCANNQPRSFFNVICLGRLFRYFLRFSSSIVAISSAFRFRWLLRWVSPWIAVIGIDRDGIILGNAIAELIGLPTILLSYEIFFESETSKQFKKPEISACRKICMAVCQGGERSLQLSLENKIPLDKIIDIPVSSRGDKVEYPPVPDLKEYFNITHDYVAVVAGSLDDWTLIDELVLTSHDWPAGWALLIHSRYGLDHVKIKHLSRKGAKNIYFSNSPLASSQEASSLFCQADLGIALYNPTFSNEFLGKNLAFLGLSSGKTAMYLQGGLPVLTTRIGEYPNLVQTYGAGFVVDNVSQIPFFLRQYNPSRSNMRSNARRLFEENIDANLFRAKFLIAFYSALT